MPKAPPKTGRIFYGWFALAGVMLVILVAGAVMFGAFAVFLPVMCGEFGWSRASLAGAMSVGVLSFGLPSPIFGVLIARFGPRSNLILGNLMAAIGIAGMSLIQEVWHIYLLYVLIGLGGGFGGYIAGTTVVNNWFIRKRSLALGMFVACAGLGNFFFPPFVTALISSVGWRIAWLILGGVFAFVSVLLGGVLLVRNRPEDMGLTPDGVPGDAYGEVAPIAVKSEQKEEQTGWFKQVVSMPTTWFIVAFIAASACINGTIYTHQIAYLQDIGYNPMTAATVASVMAAVHIVGSLGLGTLALRFNFRYLTSVAVLFQVVGMVILLTTRSLPLIYIYAACLGMGTGGVFTALPTFIGTYYRHDLYAQVMGVIFPFQVLSQAFSATAAGAIFDATGKYTPAFMALVAIGVLGFLCVLMARQPRPN